MDTDGDGLITAPDLTWVCTQLRLDASEGTVSEMLENLRRGSDAQLPVERHEPGAPGGGWAGAGGPPCPSEVSPRGSPWARVQPPPAVSANLGKRHEPPCAPGGDSARSKESEPAPVRQNLTGAAHQDGDQEWQDDSSKDGSKENSKVLKRLSDAGC